VKKINGLNIRFSHLTSTGNTFKHMNFSQNENERSSIESNNKGMGHEMVIYLQKLLMVRYNTPTEINI
jgi:hypothetical protein